MIANKKCGVIVKDTTCDKHDPILLRADDLPFRIYGVRKDFKRLPNEVAEKVNPSVAWSGLESTGGRILFRTNSDYIIIHANANPETNFNCYSSRVSLTGFDVREKIGKNFITVGYIAPTQGPNKDYIEGRLMFKESKMRDIMIFLPTFAQVSDILIGVREGSRVEESKFNYKYELPVVFYGSSIVHGAGCSSNASNYPSVVSRMINSDYINLGFGGAAHAENEIIDYIASLHMNCFVYDYDHNAPNPEELERTHYAGYERFRKQRPDVPIIMATRVDYYLHQEEYEPYRKIVIESYKKARNEGDKKVFFIDGKDMIQANMVNYAMADNVHPNDVGYYLMAKQFASLIKKIFIFSNPK